MKFWTTAVLVMLISSLGLAQTVLTEDFSAASSKVDGTAVLNLEQGRIQPPLMIENYDVTGALQEDLYFDIGDGHDGSFNSSRYAHFSKDGDVSGNIIRLDLARFPDLQVTSFTLDAGWQLIPVGNTPLIIKSQGSVVINGEILCNGGDGGSVSAMAPSVRGAGGAAICGGSDGGSGGEVGENGVSGFVQAGGPTGGGGGEYTAGVNGAGGGGGGGYYSVINAAPGVYAGGGTATIGAAGTRVDDPAFTVPAEFTGGAGGGGGSGGGSHAGAGGGAGGGVILIYTASELTLGTAGLIMARGGAGGSTPGLDSGAGGSGGGGSILLFAKSLESANPMTLPNPEVDTYALAAGVGGSGSHGGLGQAGRTWAVTLETYPSNAPVGGFDLQPDAEMSAFGDLRYVVGTSTLESKVYDLSSTLPLLQSLEISPVNSSVTVLVNGSKDNFVSHSTGWEPVTNLSRLNDNRYFKFQFSIVNADGVNPIFVNSATLTYEKGTRTEFDFRATGCGSVDLKPPTWGEQVLFLIFLLLPLSLFPALRIRKKILTRN